MSFTFNQIREFEQMNDVIIDSTIPKDHEILEEYGLFPRHYTHPANLIRMRYFKPFPRKKRQDKRK